MRIRFLICAGLVLGSVALAYADPPGRSTASTPVEKPVINRGTNGGTRGPSAGGEFDSLNVTLLGWLTRDELSTNPSDLGLNQGADIWGYVSPSGREYAIIALHAGVSFVEITDPVNPVVVGYVGGQGSIWRDMKTYQEYAYIVSDASVLGMQVVDISAIDDAEVSLVNTVMDDNFFSAHNIAVNESSGYAYTVGANIDGGGLSAWDLSDPAHPSYVNGWTQEYVHDTLVVSYDTGPFAGREIAFNFCGDSGLFVVDVTNKSSMVTLADRGYPNLTYCHQGWLSEDRNYLFVDDELDSGTTTTYIFDVADVEDPQFVTSFTNGNTSRDHNLMVRGRFVFEANYSSGLRIYDSCDIENVVEVGHFDTHPENDFHNNFDGMWGVFTAFPSGVVISSDRDRGLFVFDTSAAEAVTPPLEKCAGDPCGNGVVDVGETCDTGIAAGEPGACPTSCNDGNPCDLGEVLNGGTCQATCEFTTITEPAEGDNCCPAGANALTDSDCAAVCGNEVCEPGEAPLGCSGDCPCRGNAECVDGESCTFDLCLTDSCTNEAALFGDVASPDGVCGPDGTVNIFDILGVLDAFLDNYADGCSDFHYDLSSKADACAGDGDVTIFDILAVLDAFQEVSSCCAG